MKGAISDSFRPTLPDPLPLPASIAGTSSIESITPPSANLTQPQGFGGKPGQSENPAPLNPEAAEKVPLGSAYTQGRPGEDRSEKIQPSVGEIGSPRSAGETGVLGML